MSTALSNQELALHVLENLITAGVVDFCICPGARNASFVTILDKNESLNTHSFYEERSAAFFAIGKSRAENKPVAVITTSGTAAGELLPAIMEAYYSGIPLVVVTADRPRRFRGTGAPQAAEQVGLFGPYVSYSEDLEGFDKSQLINWKQDFPAHLNVCFEDPFRKVSDLQEKEESHFETNEAILNNFFTSVSHPIVIVGTLLKEERASVVQFLLKLNCPLILEAISGIREDKKLMHLIIRKFDKLLDTAHQTGYPIDGVLRIGGVPTCNFWRDLEALQSKIKVCSISRLPFKGLTFGLLIHTNLNAFFNSYEMLSDLKFKMEEWIKEDLKYQQKLNKILNLEKKSSPALIHRLSRLLPEKSHVYLGNSLPIREWDLSASFVDKGFEIQANRGLNGIDGQFSTFLGLCQEGANNFAILGDLTTLYDMAAPWILPQMSETLVTLFVINNGGGKIFSRMFQSECFQNCHNLSFEPFARMWDMDYEKWEEIPDNIDFGLVKKCRLIEIVPDNVATNRFLDLLKV